MGMRNRGGLSASAVPLGDFGNQRRPKLERLLEKELRLEL